jgi:hypothetical protein
MGEDFNMQPSVIVSVYGYENEWISTLSRRNTMGLLRFIFGIIGGFFGLVFGLIGGVIGLVFGGVGLAVGLVVTILAAFLIAPLVLLFVLIF